MLEMENGVTPHEEMNGIQNGESQDSSDLVVTKRRASLQLYTPTTPRNMTGERRVGDCIVPKDFLDCCLAYAQGKTEECPGPLKSPTIEAPLNLEKDVAFVPSKNIAGLKEVLGGEIGLRLAPDRLRGFSCVEDSKGTKVAFYVKLVEETPKNSFKKGRVFSVFLPAKMSLYDAATLLLGYKPVELIDWLSGICYGNGSSVVGCSRIRKHYTLISSRVESSAKRIIAK